MAITDIAAAARDLVDAGEAKLAALATAADGDAKTALADLHAAWQQVRPQAEALASTAEADLEQALPGLLRSLAAALA